MTRIIVFGTAAASALVATLVTAACSGATTQHARLERGKYLVTVGGCNDCHTPLKMGAKGPEPDMSRMLSGHPDSFPITAGTAPVSDKWNHAWSPSREPGAPAFRYLWCCLRFL